MACAAPWQKGDGEVMGRKEWRCGHLGRSSLEPGDGGRARLAWYGGTHLSSRFVTTIPRPPVAHVPFLLNPQTLSQGAPLLSFSPHLLHSKQHKHHVFYDFVFAVPISSVIWKGGSGY